MTFQADGCHSERAKAHTVIPSESRNLKNKNTNKQNKDIMERNIYETPQIQVVEVVAEGVLCESGSFEQWKEQDFGW